MKTYRFGIRHIELGYVDIKANNEQEAKEIAEKSGCLEMEVNKCEAEVEELIEII